MDVHKDSITIAVLPNGGEQPCGIARPECFVKGKVTGQGQLYSEDDPMKLEIYLNYGGNCEQAFRFYEQHLGGKITMMTTHGQQPNPKNVPASWKNTILHARIEIGETVVMGADIPPDRFQPMRSAYLTLIVDSVEEAERLYALLSDGGEIFMKMEETFSRLALQCSGTNSAHPGCSSTNLNRRNALSICHLFSPIQRTDTTWLST